MRITGKGLWIGLLIMGILQLTLLVNHGKAAEPGPAETV